MRGEARCLAMKAGHRSSAHSHSRGVSPSAYPRKGMNKASEGFVWGFLPVLHGKPPSTEERPARGCGAGFPLEAGDYSRGITEHTQQARLLLLPNYCALSALFC